MTSGKLKPLLDRASSFLVDNKENNWVETPLTAIEGDILEIEPLTVKMEQHAYAEEEMAAHTSTQCVRTEPTMENRCHLEIQPLFNSPLCLIFPVTCVPVPKSICALEKIGEHCVETQQVRDFNRPSPELIEVANAGSLPQFYDGLVLKFTSTSSVDGTAHETVCPLSAFKREASGDRMRLRLSNSPSCTLFVPGEAAPMIYIGNQIRFERKEPHGREVKNQAGQIIESPAIAVHQPRVRMSGNLSIRGAAFGNNVATGYTEPAK